MLSPGFFLSWNNEPHSFLSIGQCNGIVCVLRGPSVGKATSSAWGSFLGWGKHTWLEVVCLHRGDQRGLKLIAYSWPILNLCLYSPKSSNKDLWNVQPGQPWKPRVHFPTHLGTHQIDRGWLTDLRCLIPTLPNHYRTTKLYKDKYKPWDNRLKRPKKKKKPKEKHKLLNIAEKNWFHRSRLVKLLNKKTANKQTKTTHTKQTNKI